MGDPDRSIDRRALRIHGQVQGVGFRWWTRRQAERLGLSGTVRNCPDGTVEVTLAGEPETVAEMVRHLEQGPPGARVEGITEIERPELEPADPGSGFRIIH